MGGRIREGAAVKGAMGGGSRRRNQKNGKGGREGIREETRLKQS